ncbi:MAG: SLC13 family permease [Schleiferiaceae bacterium]
MSNKNTSLIRLAGPISAFIIAFFGGFESHFVLLGITAWMLIWWISETVHLAVTALLPLLLFPLFGLMEAKSMSSYYAHPLVYLFFGGFIIARALEETNLHYRIALWILRRTGTGSRGLLAGFMLSTAFMSMWISNTATSIMMLPIATSVLAVLPKASADRMERPLLLSIAWAANIGGMATIIGTPPNMIFAGFLSEHLDRQIGFVEWLPIGLSAAITIGLTAYTILSRSLRTLELTNQEQKETEHYLQQEWDRLGSMNKAQRKVAIIFTSTALLWIMRPYLGALSAHIHWSDTGISLLAAVLLFSLTGESGKNLLDWESTSKLPWGILILFGGGLALAGTLQQSYWFEALEIGMKSFENIPILFWVIIMALLGVFATELLSNMALVSALMPLVLSLSLTFGWSMEILSVPLVLGASCAFMLPMATPPNAIVFSTGKLTVSYMMARGIILNIIAVAILVALGMVLVTMG